MPKVIFILQRKAGTTREACLKYWEGEQHTAIMRTMPGLAGSRTMSSPLRANQRATASANCGLRATRRCRVLSTRQR
jgi:hypothetical protein